MIVIYFNHCITSLLGFIEYKPYLIYVSTT
nr:MAG TPA: hypothetical protein [Caudoviricetes sp.]